MTPVCVQLPWLVKGCGTAQTAPQTAAKTLSCVRLLDVVQVCALLECCAHAASCLWSSCLQLHNLCPAEGPRQQPGCNPYRLSTCAEINKLDHPTGACSWLAQWDRTCSQVVQEAPSWGLNRPLHVAGSEGTEVAPGEGPGWPEVQTAAMSLQCLNTSAPGPNMFFSPSLLGSWQA